MPNILCEKIFLPKIHWGSTLNPFWSNFKWVLLINLTVFTIRCMQRSHKWLLPNWIGPYLPPLAFEKQKQNKTKQNPLDFQYYVLGESFPDGVAGGGILSTKHPTEMCHKHGLQYLNELIHWGKWAGFVSEGMGSNMWVDWGNGMSAFNRSSWVISCTFMEWTI